MPKQIIIISFAMLTAGCLVLGACSKKSPPVSGDAAAPAKGVGDASVDAPPTLKNLNADGNLFGHATKAAEIEYKPLRDKKGKVSSYLPLPADWRVIPESDGHYTIVAPNNVHVNKTDSVHYSYANNQFALQSLQLAGAQIAPVQPLERIVDQALVPAAKSQGYVLLRKYPLPGVQKFWQTFANSMPRTGNRTKYLAMGTDWKDAKGNRAFIVVLQNIIRKGPMVIWSVSTTELEAPATQFDHAKEVYIHGLANTRMNPAWQRAQGYKLMQSIRRDQLESQARMRASAWAHQQEMNDIAAAGANARAIGKSNSDALDRSYASYERRQKMNDVGHAKTIDMIGERTTVSNPVTGKQFKVNSGYKYYWGDGQGGYFGTDDPLYDPRTDPNLNKRDWVKFETGN